MAEQSNKRISIRFGLPQVTIDKLDNYAARNVRVGDSGPNRTRALIELIELGFIGFENSLLTTEELENQGRGDLPW